MYIKTGTCAGRTKLNHPDVISPKNKPLFAKTLKAETAEAEPPKRYLKNRFFVLLFLSFALSLASMFANYL
jgi:hypothetical protein